MSDINRPVCNHDSCQNLVNYSIWSKTWNLYCSRSCASSMNSKNSIQKRKNTCLLKYGVEVPQQTDLVKNKVVLSNKEKYGAHPSSLDQTKLKIKITTHERWGVDNGSQSDEIKKKKIKTSIDRIGVEHHAQTHLPREIISLMHNVEWLVEQNKTKPLIQISRELGCSDSILYKILSDANIKYNTYSGYSSYQNELVNLITSINGISCIQNDRKFLDGKELDIIVPSKNLAIEMNGVYWHTEGKGKHKNYHLDKLLLCKSKGIRLIHIMDIEWVEKFDIVKSRIMLLFNNANRIYARNTNLRRLTLSEEREFFNKTHLQGYIPSSVCFGLFNDIECVAAMSFGKPRFNRNYEWELLRFSNKLYTTVVGGASKLMAQFLKEHKPETIISYSDRRWNTGDIYRILGFNFSHSSLPSYSYVDGKEMYNRMLFRKNLLERKLTIFDADLSEWENMKNNGYDRIWDCGNDVFTYSRNPL